VNFVTFEHGDSSGGTSSFFILPYYNGIEQIYRFYEIIYIFLKNIVKEPNARYGGGWTWGPVNPLTPRKNGVTIMESSCIFRTVSKKKIVSSSRALPFKYSDRIPVKKITIVINKIYIEIGQTLLCRLWRKPGEHACETSLIAARPAS
jgi:hypothetical protein